MKSLVPATPNHAGPRATILSYSVLRILSCTRAAVWWATMVRAYSNMPRKTMTSATTAMGSKSSFHAAPLNTLAMSQPSNARRARPTNAATRPMSTDQAMRPRTPRVNAHNLESKYMCRAYWFWVGNQTRHRARVGWRQMPAVPLPSGCNVYCSSLLRLKTYVPHRKLSRVSVLVLVVVALDTDLDDDGRHGVMD